MMEASAIGAAMSELAALPATSALAPPAASEGEEAPVAALAQDALVTGAAPSTLLGPDALLTLAQPDTGGDDSEKPSAGSAVERTIPSQNTHEAPTPTLAQANNAPSAVPLTATSFELRSRLVPRKSKQRRASDEDAEDRKRFSSLATAYDPSDELDPHE
jgi:hypothetical protein